MQVLQMTLLHLAFEGNFNHQNKTLDIGEINKTNIKSFKSYIPEQVLEQIDFNNIKYHIQRNITI